MKTRRQQETTIILLLTIKKTSAARSSSSDDLEVSANLAAFLSGSTTTLCTVPIYTRTTVFDPACI